MLKQNLIKWAVAAALATPIAPIVASTTHYTLHPVSLAARTTATSTVTTATPRTAVTHKVAVKSHSKLKLAVHHRMTTNSHKLRASTKLTSKKHNTASRLTSKHPKTSSPMSAMPTIDGHRT